MTDALAIIAIASLGLGFFALLYLLARLALKGPR